MTNDPMTTPHAPEGGKWNGGVYVADVRAAKAHMAILGDIDVDFLAALEEAGGVRRLAALWGLSPAYISDVRRGRRAYGPSILKRLGYRATRKVVVTYERL